MILSFHDNNHFDLIYSNHEILENHILYENLKDVKLNENLDKNNIKLSGTDFKNV